MSVFNRKTSIPSLGIHSVDMVFPLTYERFSGILGRNQNHVPITFSHIKRIGAFCCLAAQCCEICTVLLGVLFYLNAKRRWRKQGERTYPQHCGNRRAHVVNAPLNDIHTLRICSDRWFNGAMGIPENPLPNRCRMRLHSATGGSDITGHRRCHGSCRLCGC